MGAGKTTIGRKLAQMMQLSFVDLDWYIEQRYHKTVGDLFSELGEKGFREIEQKMLHEVADFEDVIISTGGGTPCFNDNMVFMNARGITVYLKLSPSQLFKRLKNAKMSRPLIKDKSDQELLEYISMMIEQREPFYKQAAILFEHENLLTKKDVFIATTALFQQLKESNL